MNDLDKVNSGAGGQWYIWRVRTRLPNRKGTRCQVLARGKMNSCLVQFEDGYKVVTSRNYLRKAPESPKPA